MFSLGYMRKPSPPTLPVWLKPVSIFGLLEITEFIISSHMFTSTPKPSPLPPNAGSSALPSRVPLHPFGVGYIVRAASHRVITDLACAPRLLLEKQQDYLRISLNSQLLTRHHVAPHKFLPRFSLQMKHQAVLLAEALTLLSQQSD